MRCTLLPAVVLFFAAGVLAFAQEGRPSPQSRLPLGKPSRRPAAAAATVPFFARTDAKPMSVVSTKDATKHKRVVYPLRSLPADQAARTLEQVFRAEGIALQGQPAKPAVIVADVITNSLIVSGAPEAVEEVQQLIEKLDQPAAMIRFEVVIAEAPLGARGAASAPSPESGGEAKPRSARKAGGEQLRVVPKPEQMEVLVRSELMTLDNQPAFVKMNRREPRVAGTNAASTGAANNVTHEEVGAVVAVTPRVGPDRVVTVQLGVDDSRLGPVEEGSPLSTSKDGVTVRTPRIELLMCQCTVRIDDGETVVLATMGDRPKSGKQRFILVTPRVLPIGAAGKWWFPPTEKPAER